MLPRSFERLPRGLKLVVLGLVTWLVGLAPLAVYLVLVRLTGDRGGGPGVPGAIGFALNVVAAMLVIGGLITWLRDGSRPPSSSSSAWKRPQ